MPRGTVRQTRYLPTSRGRCRVLDEVERACGPQDATYLLRARQGKAAGLRIACRQPMWTRGFAQLESALENEWADGCEASQLLHEKLECALLRNLLAA